MASELFEDSTIEQGDVPGPEGQDCDYLMSDADTGVLKNLSQMGERLKDLNVKMLTAEAAFTEAKKEFDYYASSVLPMAMFNAGVTDVALMDGTRLKYERKYYCSPNKNDADKQKMAAWLRELGGGHLIKEKATVDGAQLDSLRKTGIPFTQIEDINTTSLKAFIKDKLGVTSGVQQIQMDDIPPCVHFQEVGMVSISA